MHKTDAGEKRKALQREALELEKQAKILAKIPAIRPEWDLRQEEAERLKAQALALKKTKKGSKT